MIDQHCLVDSILNMLCTSLVEATTKETIKKQLIKFENFIAYIMLLSETVKVQ
jgi:hypothetical protein